MKQAQKTLELLERKAHQAACRLAEAREEILDNELRPKLRALVGKCFVYQNSYGVADGCRRWSLYSRVVELNERDMTFRTVQFERTTRDELTVRHRVQYTFRQRNPMGVENGWQLISQQQYNRALKTLLRQIHALAEGKTL